MAKKNPTTSTPSSNSPDAAAAVHGHHHHHLHLLRRQQHQQHPHKAQQAPPARAVDRFECPPEDINDSADAFIKRFRQQLELQRLQSIEDYHQMLARGL